ncbi:hypothetical protein RRF57_009386 [Xylaria bambusicola]|uniref:Uncharacterized protein n=1 Tax=Xylaria bambusicola TaxID=326684 RepID=A0AAN7UQU5_9PEZI
MAKSHEGPGDGADIVFFPNRRKIVVSFFPSHQSSQDEESLKSDQIALCLEDSLIQQISDAISGETVEYDDTMDYVLYTLLDLGQSIFDKEAPIGNVMGRSYKETLHNFLYPPTFYFRLLTTEGNPVAVSIATNESYSISEPQCDHYIEDDFDIDESLP